MDILDVVDCSVIYLSYDEPSKEEFWLKIKSMVPWAKRVDGVKGSDNAHKAAANASDTERFILIDGDNIPDVEFFNLQFDFTDKDENYKKAQYRWKARNHINGLQYGNGGISSWTKTYVMNMKTHENSNNVATTVDFCLDGSDQLYWAMHDTYSTTFPNYTPFQAWRAGFREGVKMCLVNGEKPTINYFSEQVPNRNLDFLTIWHNIGLDVENGKYAIYGARLGTYLALLTDWDHTQVQWFDNLSELWQKHKDDDVICEIHRLGESLSSKLQLPMCLYNPNQSEFFKRHYNHNSYNLGILVREMDVIRKQEGW